MTETYSVAVMTETKGNDAQSMTIAEVARMHGVSRRTVERWLAKRPVPVSKFPNGRVQLTPAAARALMAPVVVPASPPDAGTGDAAA